MKKILLIFTIILIVLLVGIFITKDYIAKQVIQNVVKKETGLTLSIEKLKLGLLNSDIEIRNFNLLNPATFSNEAFAKIPRIYIKNPIGIYKGLFLITNLFSLIAFNNHKKAIMAVPIYNKTHLNTAFTSKRNSGR